MEKGTSLSINSIKVSNSKKTLNSLKERESEDAMNEKLPNIEKLKIDTNINNQIPNNKTFNKTISSSVLTDPRNSTIECYNDGYLEPINNKSNTLPTRKTWHSHDKSYSGSENNNKKKINR